MKWTALEHRSEPRPARSRRLGMKIASTIIVRGGAHGRQPRRLAAVLAVAFLVVLAGCGGGPPQLMPTPNIYASGEHDPFPDVPPALQNNRAEVLYITDRALEAGSTPEKPTYGFKRSR